MVTLRPLISDADTDFSYLYELYVSSFPEEERRSKKGLLKSMSHSAMVFNVIEVDGVAQGFSIYWKFDGFTYLEHFAVNPNMRGNGIGASVMKLLAEILGPNRVLEVEPDVDELTHRRIGFYNRCGLNVICKDYIQPSYYNNTDAMNLWLMKITNLIRRCSHLLGFLLAPYTLYNIWACR